MIAKNFIEKLIDSDDIFLPIWDKLNEILKKFTIKKKYKLMNWKNFSQTHFLKFTDF
jgi:hypothetical protein